MRQFVFLALVLAGAVLSSIPAPAQATPPARPATADSVESHLGRGYDALKQDRYQAAEEEFRAALAIDPSLVLRAQFPLAVALFEEHKSAEARREFEAVRKQTGERTFSTISGGSTLMTATLPRRSSISAAQQPSPRSRTLRITSASPI